MRFPLFSRATLRDARVTLTLALPLVAGQLSQMLMGVADTLMIGRVGVTELAASAFANNLLYLPLVFGIGLLTSVSIRVSRARGADDPPAARATLRHGLVLAAVLGVATAAIAFAMEPFLDRFGQDEKVADAAGTYFLLVAVSMMPALAAIAVKNHADAMNQPWPAFRITLGGVLFNVWLNWLLIYGNWGFPALGLEGAGVATLIARVATVVALIVWLRGFPPLKEWVPRGWLRMPHRAGLASLLRLGMPSGLQLLAEVSAFVFATLLIGTLGEMALAAHQVAITCAATVFMVPLGLSMALTVRVGEATGAGRGSDAVRRCIVGAGLLAGIFTVASFTTVVLGRDVIASWFLTDPDALKVAAGLLLVSAAFQASDAVQITAVGGLRGLEDVRVPALVAFAAYWVLALPLGWAMAIPLGLGVSGMWWGITCGLTLTAVVLSRRLWHMSGKSQALP